MDGRKLKNLVGLERVKMHTKTVSTALLMELSFFTIMSNSKLWL